MAILAVGLIAVGIALVFLPGSFVRAEQQIYDTVTGPNAGLLLMRLLLAGTGLTLMVSGVLLLLQGQ